MNAQELSEELKGLLSQPVKYKRHAGNSIIIYFYGEPGDPEVVSFFIDPTWRLERDGRIVVGSYDFQIRRSDFKSKEEADLEWSRRCGLMSGLVGASLEDVEFSGLTGDLSLQFSGGLVVRSFANSPSHDDTWTYRNIPKMLKVKMSPLGIKVEHIEEKISGSLGAT